MSAGGICDRVCTAWVRWYTRRLPVHVADERRAEIASDLWEHRRHATDLGHTRTRHELEVIGRSLSGIPADLSWRRRVLRSQTRPGPGVSMTTSLTASRSGVLLTVLAVLGLGLAATTMPFLLAAGFYDGIDVEGIVWVLVTLVFAVPLLIGLIRGERGTEPSTALLVIGSPAPSIAWLWLPPVWLLTIAIAVTALVSRPRHGLPARPAA